MYPEAMSDLVLLEGVHALKHAVRFSAEVSEILTDDMDKALATANTVAPELVPLLASRAQVVSRTEFRSRTAQPVHTHVVAYAIRPDYTLAECMPTAEHPAILLDDPRNTKNLGAVVRVGAAAFARGILVNGAVDLFDPMAVRGAAGLQWALPCVSSPTLMDDLDDLTERVPHDSGTTDVSGMTASSSGGPTSAAARPLLVGLDAGGIPFDPAAFPGPVVFAFGSERTGLSTQVRARCDQIVSLPMAPHISSLNLATSVSAVMYLRIYAFAGGRDEMGHKCANSSSE